jgi:hypothetical protein
VAFCLGDIHLSLAKLMENYQEVIKESMTGTRVIAQPHEAKSSHIKVGKFNVILSCWWILVLVSVNHCWWCMLDIGTKAKCGGLEGLSVIIRPINQ